MSPAQAAALRAVVARLDAPVLLGGSALLWALGLDVRVRDIDLVAREHDRAAVEALPWWRATTTEPTDRLVEMPLRAEGEWEGVPLAPAAHWLLLYERYKPERALQLAPLVADEVRAAALAELGLS